jgi:hypothetical protein
MTRRFCIGLVLALPAVVLEMGGRPCRGARLGRPDAVELDPVGVRHARDTLGRVTVLRPGLAIARDAQPQHVHADRARGLCQGAA